MARFSEGWRAAGLMTHVTSLPTNYGVGDLGPSAYKLIDLMKSAGLTFWQVLPVVPTGPGLGNSPYSAFSAFAGYEILISLDLLVRDRLLSESEAASCLTPLTSEVNFEQVTRYKSAMLDLILNREGKRLLEREDFQRFLTENAIWLNDYAFYMATKDSLGGAPWDQWPSELKWREDWALAKTGEKLFWPILRQKLGQFFFFKQLNELKAAFNEAKLALIGDTAFYVNHDSSDVWANQRLFSLDSQGQTSLRAGVPPDYYAKDGQLWGNPIYNWPQHQAEGFSWWKFRLGHWLRHFDWTRLDHFRAMSACWAVPADSATAAGGYWLPAPGRDLFQDLARSGPLNIIAEDLGVITPDVTALRQAHDLPGMRVLQFGFGPDQPLSLHAPFRIEPDNFVYPGTHDNNTTRGWFRQEITVRDRQRISDLAGFQVEEINVAWALTRLAWLSPGAVAITTLADLLNLDERARFNTPGQPTGNWAWRANRWPNPRTLESLAELTELAGRDNMAHPNILTY
ncbi:MAG: 4-alpha-glucanotransferase [Deltaproteobacteria bacterium]|jgi:4-alpha-glucanotransferase|nr:4-alpha-glucanotransferase [Deltaproteobacteria bacterium]